MIGEPLKGGTLFLGAIGLSLCTFMQVLDYSIANVSIPYISGDLAVSLNDGTWVITMFAVGNAIGLPLTGWITKRFGSIRVMVISTVLFTLFSVLCGLSLNIGMLVVMRFIQGLVAGPLIPLSQSLMILTFPKEKKNTALALWSMVAVVGPVAGPILGGWITYNYSWPWIFYINVPFGVFCSIIIWKLYKTKETLKEKLKVDTVGIILLAIGVCALQIILDQGEQHDWWRSSLIWTLTVISIVATVFFIIWEIKDSDPIMDFRFFKNRNFALGTILISLSYMSLFGVIVISPLWLQTFMGYTAQLAGLAVSTLGILPFCTVLVVSKLMGRIRLKYMVMFSFLSYGAALLYFTTFNTEVTFYEVAMSRLYLGMGLCSYMAPLTAITFAHFSEDKLATGQGIFHFFRIFMGGVGTSIFVTAWNRRATHHHSNLVDSINPFNSISKDLFDRLRDYRITGKQALQTVDNIAWTQSYMLSSNDIFWAAAWGFFIFAFFSLLFKKRKVIDQDAVLVGE